MSSPIMNQAIVNNTMTANASSPLLPVAFVPTEQHVIIGRGKKHSKHSGNLRYGELVRDEMHAYADAENKAAKSEVISRLVSRVRLGGNFVREVSGSSSSGATATTKTTSTTTQRWALVEEHAVRTTTAQHFRDALHNKYRSSKAMKKQKRNSQSLSGTGGNGNGAVMAMAVTADCNRCVSPESSSSSCSQTCHNNQDERLNKRARVSCVLSEAPLSSAPWNNSNTSMQAMPAMPKLQTQVTLPSMHQTTMQLGMTMNGMTMNMTMPPMMTSLNGNDMTNNSMHQCSNDYSSAFSANFFNNGSVQQQQVQLPSSNSNAMMEPNPFEPTPIREQQQQQQQMANASSASAKGLLGAFLHNNSSHTGNQQYLLQDDLDFGFGMVEQHHQLNSSSSSNGGFEPMPLLEDINHRFIF